MQCHCGKPAILQIPDGPPLCMDCWATFQRTNQENMRFAFAMINHLQDEMAFTVGLPSLGPKLQIPQATYIGSAPVTMNTTNNIHVESGSQVGQINAGSIVYLDRVVSEFKAGGAGEFATAMQTFTQAIIDSRELEAASQSQILDLLRAVIEELKKSKESRNLSVLKIALQTIGSLTSVVTSLASH
jgi:hypothetical protein